MNYKHKNEYIVYVHEEEYATNTYQKYSFKYFKQLG